MLFNSMVTLGLGVVSTPTYPPSYRQFIKYFYPQTFCGGGEVSDRTNFLLDNIYIDFLSMFLHPVPRTNKHAWLESRNLMEGSEGVERI